MIKTTRLSASSDDDSSDDSTELSFKNSTSSKGLPNVLDQSRSEGEDEEIPRHHFFMDKQPERNKNEKTAPVKKLKTEFSSYANKFKKSSEKSIPNNSKGRSSMGSYSNKGRHKREMTNSIGQPKETGRLGLGMNKRSVEDSDSSSDSDEEAKWKVFSSGANKMEAASLEAPISSNNIGRSMMVKMGYGGKGLGRFEQGMVDPVKLSKQQGRLGLGSVKTEVDLSSAFGDYDLDLEFAEVEEEVYWLSCSNEVPIDIDTLRSWKIEGEKDFSMDEMNDFCDPEILKGVLRNKAVFDSLTDDMRIKFLKARQRCNPFETIGGGIFLNRAAMKMANIDSRFDWMFTKPRDQNDEPLVNSDELLYFADVCAGPGGFSEYVFWRKKWRAKGFGFTLKNENDFKLQDFYSGPCETFEPYYGTKGDGNIYDPENIVSLTDLVMRGTKNNGVHFMMADGGFSVKGQELAQEILSKRLYLTQFLVALNIVRYRGNFVCKLFDVFTPFSAGLIYLMYHCFDRICIFKPNTSRPANSERYLVCNWKKSDDLICNIREYMCELNIRMNEMGDSDMDITHCVPITELKDDTEFFDYLVESNNRLGRREMCSLAKISLFYTQPERVETRQDKLASSCLSVWNVPAGLRTADNSTCNDVIGKILCRNHPCKDVLNKKGELLNYENLKHLQSIYSWKYVMLGTQKEYYFYLGLGRSKVWRYNKFWDNYNKGIELPPGTLVYGELVPELNLSGRTQRKFNVLHIFDAISLGYEDISSLHYEDRLKTISLFVEAMKKYSVQNISLRVKTVYNLEDANHIFKRLKVICDRFKVPTLYTVMEDGNAFVAKGALFFKTVTDSWVIAKSTKSGQLYYYNITSRDSVFDRPQSSVANVMDCISEQKIWEWEYGTGLKSEPRAKGILHKDDFIQFLENSKRC